jgi:hypothetical protein
MEVEDAELQSELEYQICVQFAGKKTVCAGFFVPAASRENPQKGNGKHRHRPERC